MPAKRLAVVGGGWAGLAAAVEATLRGHAVTLFEMAPQWGGRARRVEANGMALDNGQHILIGAYTESLRLMRTVGVDVGAAFLRTPLSLMLPDGRGLQLPPGSPLIAFARGVIARRGWMVTERLALLAKCGRWALQGFRCEASLTVAQLTADLPLVVRDELIEPLCVAALNTPGHSASGLVFLRVIRDALFSGPGSADLLLPRYRLSDLWPEPAIRWLQARGARLRLPARVGQVEREGGGWRIDGERYDAAVLATTAVEAARLAKEVAPGWAAQAAALHYEPIVTVYARSEGTRLPHPMFALEADDERQPAQFVFDQGHLGGPPGVLAFVISGAAPWLERGAEAAREATLEQGNTLLARHLQAPLQPIRVLTEKRATFRCLPALQRPPSVIAPGLHAAGDYVAGPYPATLEGAVRSAMLAVSSFS
jgi:squalene-associated FAD-dependent desaturase